MLGRTPPEAMVTLPRSLQPGIGGRAGALLGVAASFPFSGHDWVDLVAWEESISDSFVR